jgi:hypothetical protein
VISVRLRFVLQGYGAGVEVGPGELVTIEVRVYYVLFISPKSMLGVVQTLLG